MKYAIIWLILKRVLRVVMSKVCGNMYCAALVFEFISGKREYCPSGKYDEGSPRES